MNDSRPPAEGDVFSLKRGDSPLVVSIPHAGTFLPGAVAERMTPEARALPDTDWDVPALYDFTDDLGASRIEAKASRSLIALNRDPAGDSLYPGRATTELVPTVQFDGSPIYLDGHAPDDEEIATRRARWFGPYHDALIALLSATIDRHGYAVLWDAHSARPPTLRGRPPGAEPGQLGGPFLRSDRRVGRSSRDGGRCLLHGDQRALHGRVDHALIRPS